MTGAVDQLGPLDRILATTPVLRVGQFRVTPRDPRFHDSGPIERHVFVFPRNTVRIRHAGAESFVADPNVATFYNRGQVYSRAAVSAEGDFCDWFAVSPELLTEITADLRMSSDETAPFRLTHAPVDRGSFLLERHAVRLAALGAGQHLLAVEEIMLEILCRLLRGVRARHRHAAPRQREALVARAKEALASRLGEPLTLDEIARHAGVSVFHLCRTFRSATGLPLHQYRMSLRLRRAFDLLASGAGDILDVALEVGFTSHSHFTHFFHRTFGRLPSDVRRAFVAVERPHPIPATSLPS